MRGRVKYDVYYIENWSVLMDIQIFFKTIYLKNKGLYEISKLKDPVIGLISGSLFKIWNKLL